MLTGKGTLLSSIPRNRKDHPCGNYAGRGLPDIKHEARGVTPTSDVTVRRKAMTNLGRSEAAGWLPVPGNVGQVIQMLQTGSGVQLESPGTGRIGCKAVAGSFACYRWCWAQCNDERTDEFYPSKDVTGVGERSSIPGLGKGVNAVKGIWLGRAGFL